MIHFNKPIVYLVCDDLATQWKRVRRDDCELRSQGEEEFKDYRLDGNYPNAKVPQYN